MDSSALFTISYFLVLLVSPFVIRCIYNSFVSSFCATDAIDGWMNGWISSFRCILPRLLKNISRGIPDPRSSLHHHDNRLVSSHLLVWLLICKKRGVQMYEGFPYLMKCRVLHSRSGVLQGSLVWIQGYFCYFLDSMHALPLVSISSNWYRVASSKLRTCFAFSIWNFWDGALSILR